MSEISTLIEGKYDVIAKIREGGMGTIYKVRHRLLEEIRVVKVMRQSVVGDAELKRRFLEEAKTATRLKHPNIATIYDFALGDDGTAYLVMEFIDGITLGELLKSQGSVGLMLSLEIAHQTLLALGYLHRRNVIHRDISPDNLMLTCDEEGETRIKLIDLGIAKVLGRLVEMTSTGVFLGKVRYASPEQYGALFPGETIDGRSDLYSLGLVLYELLTGRRPFVGETPVELLRAHVFQSPAPFSETDPDNRVPEEVRSAVLKALEKKRDDRFASAQDFDREISALRVRFMDPYYTDAAQALIALVRGSPRWDADFVTPSAQDRLNRQFLAHPTPAPASDPSASQSIETVVDPKEKEARFLEEIREREARRDLRGLEAIAQASLPSSRVEQAVLEAIARVREQAAREKRDVEAADWRECSAQGTEKAWQGYLQRHPDSSRRDDAIRMLSEARAFREAGNASTVEAWKAYVQRWPQGPHRGEADKWLQEAKSREDEAFAGTTQIGTAEALRESVAFEAAGAGGRAGWESFLKSYPRGRHNAAARTALRKIYEVEADEIYRRDQESLLLQIRQHLEAGRRADLELLAKAHPAKSAAGEAVQAALRRLAEAERQKEAAAQAAQEELRQKLEAERREREAEEQRKREAEEQGRLEAQRQEREAEKQRRLEAERQEREAEQELEQQAAKQQKLEAKRLREVQEPKSAVHPFLGSLSSRTRLFGALAAIVVIAVPFLYVGAWKWSHRANKSAVPNKVAISGVGGQTRVSTPPPAVLPVVTGSLVVDALPWAEVVSIEDSAGKNWLNGKQNYTPMVIALPPGKYSVSMKNDEFPGRPVSVKAVVKEGESTTCVWTFQKTDAAAYFEMEGWRR